MSVNKFKYVLMQQFMRKIKHLAFIIPAVSAMFLLTTAIIGRQENVYVMFLFTVTLLGLYIVMEVLLKPMELRFYIQNGVGRVTIYFAGTCNLIIFSAAATVLVSVSIGIDEIVSLTEGFTLFPIGVMAGVFLGFLVYITLQASYTIILIMHKFPAAVIAYVVFAIFVAVLGFILITSVGVIDTSGDNSAVEAIMTIREYGNVTFNVVVAGLISVGLTIVNFFVLKHTEIKEIEI